MPGTDFAWNGSRQMVARVAALTAAGLGFIVAVYYQYVTEIARNGSGPGSFAFQGTLVFVFVPLALASAPALVALAFPRLSEKRRTGAFWFGGSLLLVCATALYMLTFAFQRPPVIDARHAGIAIATVPLASALFCFLAARLASPRDWKRSEMG